MPPLSTARETLQRLNARIAKLSDARQKSWLTVYRDHWWSEVIGDVDAIMATMSRTEVSYSFDGHPFLTPDKTLASIDSFEAVRRMYAGVAALGVKMAGPLDAERIRFDERGLTIAGILTCIYPGVYLAKHDETVNPEALYLLRWPSITEINFDADGLMMGEDIMNGAPILLRRVDASMTDCLIDGPLPDLA